MKKTFMLEGLCCANCAAKIEKEIKKTDGVNDVTVNFITTKMVIDGDENRWAEIVKKARKIVKKIEPDVTMAELN